MVRWGTKTKLAAILLVLSIIEPCSAWGSLTHVRMSDEAGIPYPGWKMEYLSGSIAPDAGYVVSASWGNKFHGRDVDKALTIANTMFRLAENREEKAFAKGWLAHLMQDRVAHGGGTGLPNDDGYGVGYSNYAAEKYGLSHIEAEFYVDGRVFYEKGWNWDFVKFAVPLDLVIDTMNSVYGTAPDRGALSNAYNSFASEYFGELTFWSSPAGNALYLSLKVLGKVSDYDKYVNEIHCNPYERSIYLTQHPQEKFTSSAKNSPEHADKEPVNAWMVEYVKRLEKAGAIKINRKMENGWLTVEFRIVDKAKMNKVAENLLEDMVRSGMAPKNTLRMLKIVKLERVE